jgi:O-antigen/teichoic acid export membrane protein
MSYIQQIIDWFKTYPELIAVVCALLASWGLTGSLESIIPNTLAPWKQKLITLVAGFLVAVVVSVLIWLGVDPKEAHSVAWGVSITAGLIAPLAYIWIGGLLSHFFPFLSAWAPKPPGGGAP